MTERAMQLNDDGTIKLELGDGRTYVLRRPRLGEYRQLKTKLNEGLADMNARAKELASVASGEMPVGDWDDGSQFLVEWVTTAIELLSGVAAPDPDEWPAWLGSNGKLPGQWMAHWREVPLDHG